MVPSYRIMVNNRDATMIKSWNEAAVADSPDHINVYISNFGPIPPRHHIHHIDNNPENNDPSNLMALPRIFHKNLHSDYYFYFNLATKGRMNKQILQSVLDYYASMKYSLSKKFSVVFMEYLFLSYNREIKPEPVKVVYKDDERYVALSRRVKGALAPFHKQNDLFFGVGGVYNKLSKEQVDKCLEKVLQTISELYSEVKMGRI